MCIVKTNQDATVKATPKVLLVEDEPLIALDLAYILREVGAEVLGPYPDAAGAIALLANCRPDAALLDHGLADGCAGAIAKALALADVPFALVTGYWPALFTEPSFANVPIVEKPYSFDDIRHVLIKLVRGESGRTA